MASIFLKFLFIQYLSFENQNISIWGNTHQRMLLKNYGRLCARCQVIETKTGLEKGSSVSPHTELLQSSKRELDRK